MATSIPHWRELVTIKATVPKTKQVMGLVTPQLSIDEPKSFRFVELL